MEFWARPGFPSTSKAPAQASVLLAPHPPWEAPNVALFSVGVKHWALPPALGPSQVGQDSGSKQGGRRQAGREGRRVGPEPRGQERRWGKPLLGLAVLRGQIDFGVWLLQQKRIS